MNARRLIMIAAAVLAPSALAAKLEIKPEKTSVAWQAHGNPGGLRINAKGGHAAGWLEDDGKTVTGELSVKVSDFKTGIDMRDEHMLSAKYLDGAGHPEATLKLDHQPKNGAFTGLLTIKGVTKPVSGTVTSDAYGFKAEMAVNLKDYRPAVEEPRYRGIGIEDAVTVTVEGKL